MPIGVEQFLHRMFWFWVDGSGVDFCVLVSLTRSWRHFFRRYVDPMILSDCDCGNEICPVQMAKGVLEIKPRAIARILMPGALLRQGLETSD